MQARTNERRPRITTSVPKTRSLHGGDFSAIGGHEGLCSLVSYRVTTVLFGTVFIAFGALILAIALGSIHAEIHAPWWVVAAAGLAFLFAGMTVVFQALPVSGGFHWAASLLLLLCLALPYNWVAFGPGERQFTSTTTAGAGSRSEPVSESEGRIVFGLAALLVNALAVAAVVKAFRRSPSPKPDGTLPLEEATTLPAPHRLRPHPPPRAVR